MIGKNKHKEEYLNLKDKCERKTIEYLFAFHFSKDSREERFHIVLHIITHVVIIEGVD